MINFQEPDLNIHPPRSPRVRLGGFVHLPRLLDKARAFNAGKHGDFTYPCPMDQRLLDFVGIESDSFLAAVKTGKSDTAMLCWVTENSTSNRRPHEILAWSNWMENAAPGDPGRHRNFAAEIERLAPGRTDIVTTFDRLELDDYVTYGGRG
jgi:hypothetical protein